MSDRRSSSAERRRERMPVRLTIQASSTPRRSAIGPLGTTSGGTWWPSPRIVAVRGGATVRPLWRASRATAARSGGSVALRMRDLHVDRFDLGAGDDPLAEARQHLAGADLDEAAGAGLVQRGERLAPADRVRQRGGELGAHVLERLRARARDHREAGLGDLDLGERL